MTLIGLSVADLDDTVILTALNRGFFLITCGDPTYLARPSRVDVTTSTSTARKQSSNSAVRTRVLFRVDVPPEREPLITAQDIMFRANLELMQAGSDARIQEITNFSMTRYIVQSGSSTGQGSTLGIAVGVGGAAAVAGAATLLVVRRRRRNGKLDIKRKLDLGNINEDDSQSGGSPRSFVGPSADQILDLMRDDNLDMDMDSDDGSSVQQAVGPSSNVGDSPEFAKIRYGSVAIPQQAMIDFLNDSDDDDDNSDDDDLKNPIAVPEAPPAFVEPHIEPSGFSMIPAVMGASRMSVFAAAPMATVAPEPETSAFAFVPAISMPSAMRSSITGLPVQLQRGQSKFWSECDRVFKWLDDDNDGFVSDREISLYLGISRHEARALIEETKITLYGKRGDNRLTQQEFSSILASANKAQTTTTDVNLLPPRVLKRYRMIFDSIDVDGNGAITPEELAQDMGIGEIDEGMRSFLKDAGYGDKSELSFEEFVNVLRQAETDRAGRTFKNILAETEQGVTLAAAVDVHQQKAKEVVKAEDIPESITMIWDELATNCALERDELRVDADTVQSAVLTAHARGQLDSSDDALLQLVWQVSEAARTSPDGMVGFAEYAKVMKACVISDSDAPGLGRCDTGYKSSASWEMPSETLNPDEMKVLHQVFDDNDTDRDGQLQTEQLNHLFLEMSDTNPDARVFYFQVIAALENSGETSIDFEQFVVLMQEAAEASASDIPSALEAITMMKRRVSRRSKMLFRFTPAPEDS